MAKTTSIALGDHFTTFLADQVATGRYGSASEVVRAGLRLLEEQAVKLEELRALLKEGEESGDAAFDPKTWLAEWNAEWVRGEDSRKPKRA